MSGSLECTDGGMSSGAREVARCGATHSYPSASSKGDDFTEACRAVPCSIDEDEGRRCYVGSSNDLVG
jgi:hypothetical protein